MRPTDVLDDLLATGEVVVDEHSCAACAHCGLILGPAAAVGLIVRRAITHMLDDTDTRNQDRNAIT